ncbi:hypothetical protein WMY93_006143 [Mugilogobius chulae]|uniref:Uncharacterized protein n=1 Tax=Mugilogobius chulae TaxID=88201 RepID=A0AAW0PYE0_9GOBI
MKYIYWFKSRNLAWGRQQQQHVSSSGSCPFPRGAFSVRETIAPLHLRHVSSFGSAFPLAAPGDAVDEALSPALTSVSVKRTRELYLSSVSSRAVWGFASRPEGNRCSNAWRKDDYARLRTWKKNALEQDAVLEKARRRPWSRGECCGLSPLDALFFWRP